MLADAKAVTGKSTTKLTVLALEQLPDLLAKWQRDQAAGIAQFLKQHAGAQMPEAQPEEEESRKRNQVVRSAVPVQIQTISQQVPEPSRLDCLEDDKSQKTTFLPGKKGGAMKENQVNAERARHLLGNCKECDECSGRGCEKCGDTGWLGEPGGRTRMSALKRAMGIGGRYFFLSQVRQFLVANPTFKETDVYPKKPVVKNQTSIWPG